MKTVLRGELVVLEVDDAEKYAWLSRTSLPTRSDPGGELEALGRAVASLRAASMTVVVDVRRAVGRNDDEFEQRIVPAFRRIVESFQRRAFLVATEAGKLQVKRLGAAFAEFHVFTDEAEARRFAAS